MGGTFDPIHYGHLVTAEIACKHFNLDEVVFVPTGNPPHKVGQKVSDPEHRFRMTLLATVNNPHFSISDIEITREGFSYSYDTVQYFKEKYENEIDIYFITGADAVNEITTWSRFDQLIKECNFIAATRPGYSLSGLAKNEDFPKALLSKLNFMQVPALSISSTDIRKKVVSGEPIKYLLPEPVENYIYKNGLYIAEL